MRALGVAGLVALLLVTLLLAAGAYAFTFALREGGPREIVLVAKDMAFVAEPGAGLPAGATRSGPSPAPAAPPPDDGPTDVAPGPTIVLRAGERVRLVLRNQDPGMRHDLVADHLRLRTKALDHGEADEILFRAPSERSEGDYYCSFHSRLMRGRIVVR